MVRATDARMREVSPDEEGLDMDKPSASDCARRLSTLVKTSPPFVGRREELAWLEDILQGVHAGQPRVVLLLGEAGIGKTRLLRVTRIILTPGIREDLPINPTGEDEDIWVIRAKHKPLNEVEIVTGQDIYVSQQVVENVVETVRLRQTK